MTMMRLTCANTHSTNTHTSARRSKRAAHTQRTHAHTPPRTSVLVSCSSDPQFDFLSQGIRTIPTPHFALDNLRIYQEPLPRLHLRHRQRTPASIDTIHRL
eukprot:m.1648758 g.1648758  ORF g.1648758 m.1648758 type:complete len:101 (+) comp80905_c0_seq1:2-304(+)